jgi:hypothetical protein
MSATTNNAPAELGNLMTRIEDAAAKVIARLADRAAYANGEEYHEIRGLITALRGLAGNRHVAPG